MAEQRTCQSDNGIAQAEDLAECLRGFRLAGEKDIERRPTCKISTTSSAIAAIHSMAEKNPAKQRIKRHVGSIPSRAVIRMATARMRPAAVRSGMMYLPAVFSAAASQRGSSEGDL